MTSPNDDLTLPEPLQMALGHSTERARLRDSALALAVLKERLRTEANDLVGRPVRTRPSSLGVLPRWMGYGAIVTGLVAIVSIHYISATKPAVRQYRTYTTTSGQRANITLGDGSKVLLAPATTLKIGGSASRTIDLVGEATFTVTPDTKAPFLVRTGNYETRVLGTTFSVRRYNTEAVARVVVAEGKVSVQSVILTAGQGASVSSESTVPLTDAEVTRTLARSSGRLVFENAPVDEVFADLSRWYTVIFVGTEQIRPTTRVTMTFADSRLSTEKLNTLGAILGCRVTLKGNVVHIVAE